MVSSPCHLSDPFLSTSSAANRLSSKLVAPQRRKSQPVFSVSNSCSRKSCLQVSASWQWQQEVRAVVKSLPVAASAAVLLWSGPASAGFLSGITGIESIPGPELPKVEFLERFNEENQKQYAEFDKRFNESPLLKKLLEKSKLNKEKNKQEIQDKYCLRGAEWGVGDCSAEGMTQEDRDKFIAMLKAKVGDE
uniref:Uncharacterized protein n=1 Tax=Kalanchoe fedtschenkoi TaxID=63787 RepID=A0A7N0UJ69_KALFE